MLIFCLNKSIIKIKKHTFFFEKQKQNSSTGMLLLISFGHVSGVLLHQSCSSAGLWWSVCLPSPLHTIWFSPAVQWAMSDREELSASRPQGRPDTLACSHTTTSHQQMAMPPAILHHKRSNYPISPCTHLDIPQSLFPTPVHSH